MLLGWLRSPHKISMPFNHYAKIKRILQTTSSDWFVRRIDEPTSAKNFKGETRQYDHYYRVYDSSSNPIPYCKFQQLDLFAKTMGIDAADIIIQSNL